MTPNWLTLAAWRAEINLLTMDPKLLGPAGRLMVQALELKT
jgi:hypothetical protein